VSNLRLVIGDDHTLVRQGLRKILEERPAWQVMAEVGDGRDAIRQCDELNPDVAVLDVAMPILNGIDATMQITKRCPQTRVLILSMHSDEAYVARALHAGASGYVLKDCAGTELIAAVDSVARGGVFFSAPITRVMLEDYIRRVRETGSIDRFDMLSPREREIFQLIAEGRTNKEVAALLDISAATVETHRARILQKLDLHNAAELVLYAARRGVVT
jgi:DNA-binding NarL/FixJ family response regulator